MAENMFSSDGSSQSGDVFSSVTQIPSMEHTGKEAIQAQSQSHSSVQSTGRKEPIQAQSQSHSSVQSTRTVSEEEEEEEEEAERSAIGPLADINENYLIPRDKELLRTAKEALKKLSETYTISWPKKQHSNRK